MYVDISRKICGKLAIYNGDPVYKKEIACNIKQNGFEVSKITFGSHFGTHIDAPKHFIKNGKAIDDFDISYFCGRAKVISFLGTKICKEDIEKFQICQNDIILIKANTHFNGFDMPKNYTGIDENAALFLAQTKIKMVGIDFITIGSHECDEVVHNILLRNSIPILENIDLSMVEEGEYEIFAFPLNIENGDAAPVRAVLKSC